MHHIVLTRRGGCGSTAARAVLAAALASGCEPLVFAMPDGGAPPPQDAQVDGGTGIPMVIAAVDGGCAMGYGLCHGPDRCLMLPPTNCCSGMPCSSGFICAPDQQGMGALSCVPCGAQGQACCIPPGGGRSYCDTGLNCIASTTGMSICGR